MSATAVVPATQATDAKPVKEKPAPAGLAIMPVRGKVDPLKEQGVVIVASRTHVGKAEAPATRIFAGPHPAGWKPGTKFETHHAKNLAPCGEFTIDAVITGGVVKGKFPEGTGRLSVLMLAAK